MDNFLKVNQHSMEALGFWAEQYRRVIIWQIEKMYKADVLRDWYISDIVMNGDKVLLKWNKRLIPLTDDQLKKDYQL